MQQWASRYSFTSSTLITFASRLHTLLQWFPNVFFSFFFTGRYALFFIRDPSSRLPLNHNPWLQWLHGYSPTLNSFVLFFPLSQIMVSSILLQDPQFGNHCIESLFRCWYIIFYSTWYITWLKKMKIYPSPYTCVNISCIMSTDVKQPHSVCDTVFCTANIFHRSSCAKL